MNVYYVEWWDVEAGILRRHFSNVDDARAFHGSVSGHSSGESRLLKVKLHLVKQDVLTMLNHATLSEPTASYPNSVLIAAAPPSHRVIAEHAATTRHVVCSWGNRRIACMRVLRTRASLSLQEAKDITSKLSTLDGRFGPECIDELKALGVEIEPWIVT